MDSSIDRSSGNTCFISAALQALCAIPDLAACFSSYSYPDLSSTTQFSPENCRAIRRLGSVINTLLSNQKPSEADIRLLAGAASHREVFDWVLEEQQDSHEFLLGMLSRQNEYAAKAGQAAAVRPSNDVLDLNGIIKQECIACNTTEIRDGEVKTQLKLLMARFEHLAGSSVPLTDVLDVHFEQEDAVASCPGCHIKWRQYEQIRVFPKVMLFQLCNFTYKQIVNPDGTMGYIPRKITTKVTLPFSLSLAKFAEHDIADDPTDHYDLVSIVHHDGETVNSGHYVASIYTGTRWYFCNDEIVSQCTPLQARDPPGNFIPYLAFYRRRNAAGSGP